MLKNLASGKDEIKLPKKFKNYNIKSINYKDNIIAVDYNNKDYIVFNYLTGEVVKEDMTYKSSIEEFVKEYFSNTVNDITKKSTSEEYKKAKSIVSKLNAKSIDEVLNETSDKTYIQKSNYSISYNNLTNDYEIIEIPKEDNAVFLSNIESTDNVSSMINNNAVLLDYYVPKTKKFNVVSSVIVMAPILGCIFIVIIILRNYFMLDKKEENA